MIGDGSADERSFLQLWVTGFDGLLDSRHALAYVTWVSVCLIGVAIGLFVAPQTPARAEAEPRGSGVR